ncbi:MAG: YgeY family selenium metabolism-linked hydrolase [Calditrichaeota bacterium]|nr:MAG: YgeY family selenium metabolism-linked hydrolase [Calditrichota bacterium]
MHDLLEKAKAVESDLVEFLKDVVKLPLGSGQEGPVIERMKQEMQALGYDEVKVDPLGNLFGRVGSGPRTLAIDGHCDVVDIGNRENWEVDPIGCEIIDGEMYGRGACDQKGGLTGAIYAGGLLKKHGMPDDLTLWVVASVMEEDCDGMCWDYIVTQDQFRPEAVLITEPTNLNIYRGQRGRLEMKVQTSGISAHGSAPERGVNAIYKMAPIIQEIEQLHTRLKDDAFLGKGSVTVTDVRSTAPSLCAVADSCTIHLDRRLTAGETIDSALDEVRSLPAFKKGEAKAWVPEYPARAYTGLEYAMQSYFPTWVLDEGHPALQSAVKSYRNLFGGEPKVDKWTFSTNGVTIMGKHGIPTLGFGPGNEIYAHAPNERIPIDHLHKAVAFYMEFVRNF